MDLDIILLLSLAALVAGFIDAIAGGGGLITLPALLIAGVAPTDAIATNKLQGTFGVATASASYYKSGLIDLRVIATAVAATAVGAAAGSMLVSNVDPGLLHRFMPFALGAAAPIGFYDGVFGPGAGSLYTLAFLAAAGCNLITATANAKLLNVTSNLTSLGVFLASGHVNFAVGLPMALGQSLGAWVGAHTALKHGTRIIRPLLVATTSAAAVKLLMSGLRFDMS